MIKILKKIIPKSIYRFLLALTGNIVYGFPGYKMTVIGVTGTNGKSTCVEIITEILKAGGEKVGMISTVTIEIAGDRQENKTGRTTIGRWGTHRVMREMVTKGCGYAVIEASSEGIAGKRIWGIPFDGAIFTGLAPEHLNYHGDMENYRNTKGILFKKLSSAYNLKRTKRVSVVNADDEEAEYFHSFRADKKYLFGAKRGNIKARNIKLGPNETKYEIEYDGKEQKVTTKALGEFNVMNELAAFCIGLGYGITPEKMIKVFRNFRGTKGRAEKIDEGQNFDLIVDYAVTPDAQKILYKSFRQVTSGRLISVFGATGDKDKTKRPEMGKVASEMTDVIILTDDETYTEDSKKIIDEVYAGVMTKNRDKVQVLSDRLKAIKKAISLAKAGDTVIITGIGHQKFRNMGGKKIDWDERQIVRDLLKNIKS